MITKVIFRKFSADEVIALFPQITGTRNYESTCQSYMHMGQHGSAEVSIVQNTVPAKESEYKELKEELESLGYCLNIGQRFTRKDFQARKADAGVNYE